jgi:hypothetical protein
MVTEENIMNRWIALLMTTISTGLSAWAVDIDNWSFTGDSLNSDQSTYIGSNWESSNQLVPDPPGDNAITLTPSNSFFSGQKALSSSIDVTANPEVRLTIDYNALDFSTNNTANSQFGFRLWTYDALQSQTNWVGISIMDNFNNDKVFARFIRDPALGGADANAGRLVNGLGPDSTPRTVVMDINFELGEVSVSSPAWQWSSIGGSESPATFTYSLPAITNWTSVDRFQTQFANQTDGDTITIDNILVEYLEDPPVIVTNKLEYWTFDDALNTSFGNATNSGSLGSAWTFGGPATWSTDGAGKLVVSNHQGETFRRLPDAGTANADPTTDFYADPFTSGVYRMTLDLDSFEMDPAAAVGDVTLQARTLAGKTVAAIRVERQTASNARVRLFHGDGSGGTTGFRNFDSGLTNSTGVKYEIEFDYDAGTVSYITNGVQSHTFAGFTNNMELAQIQFNSSAAWSSNSIVTINEMGLTTYEEESVTPTNTPTSLWNDWINSYPGVGANTNLLDHGDSDTLDNLTEYAYGGNPADGSSLGNTPEQSQAVDGGTNYLVYVYYARDDAGDRGLAYLLTTDTDLVNAPGWTNANYEVVGTNTSTGISGFNAVTNRIPTDSEDNQFIRLQIEFTP